MARKGYKVATFIWQGQRKYCYGKTAEEAKSKADKQKALLEAKVHTVNSTYTVEAWAYKWLDDYKKDAVGDAWYRQIKSIIERHIVPYIGDMLMRDVTASDIQRLMNRCSKFSASHQKKIAQTILQIFDSAEENDIVIKVPIKRIKTAPRGQNEASRALTEQERSLVLRTADKYPDEGLFFLIMLFCGCRPQEVSRLKMSDYDGKSRTLYVHEARKADGSTGSPKSASGTRLIPVPKYLAERLDKLNKRQDDLICASQEGRPLTKTTQKRLWHKFKRKMDMENGALLFRNGIVQTTLAEDLRPYCLRHTYCTDLQDAGVPVTVAKDLMGHSDIKMTANIYTHKSSKSFEDARDKIDALHSK